MPYPEDGPPLADDEKLVYIGDNPAPHAVILELARESSKKEYCFPIYPCPLTRQRASPRVTGSGEPSCCVNAQGGSLFFWIPASLHYLSLPPTAENDKQERRQE